jgi:hypothetical protein
MGIGKRSDGLCTIILAPAMIAVVSCMVDHFVSQNKSVHRARWCVLCMTVFHSALDHFYHVFVDLESK